jgi:F0F1-type ATP synthase assembly protein I
MSFCKYKDVFGKVKEGPHSYRIFNIAIVDTLLTIIIGYLISKYFKLKLINVLIVLFILGIIVHKIFCVETTLTKLFS